ncbi:13789_t:CDS:2, partial [Dentiscutata erythropus]
SFKRNLTTTQSITKNTSNSNDNTFTKSNIQEHCISAISAEKIIDRIKFLKENIYNRINYELLEDFPKWLKGLHMQNLAHHFEGKKWQEIKKMDDKHLEKLGITDHVTRSILGSHFWAFDNNKG